MNNNYIRQAEILYEKIGHLIPGKGGIDIDKLNINVAKLVDVPKAIDADIPKSMATLFAIYNMSNFASQFHFRMQIDDLKLPCNMVGFLLSKSGQGKDSTLNAQRQALDAGFNMIEQKREDRAKKLARNKAEQEDGDDSNWGKYMKKLQPLENSISTIEGLVARLNTFAQDGIGMPTVSVSEVGSELQTNPNMTDNIRLISELYDVGNYKSKAIKDQERQDQEVRGMAMNAMFMGSEDNIILDKAVSQKFKMEFMTKLARRSIFVYPTASEFEEAMVEYNSYEDMKTKEADFEYTAKAAKAYVGQMSMEVAETFLNEETRMLTVDEDTIDLYKDYKRYCKALGNGLDYLYKAVKLEQSHRSWKTLKLAGVFAMWDRRFNVTTDDLEEAIYITEKFGHYLSEYEEYAAKEEYELLVDYFIAHPEHNLSLHELKKRQFVTGTSNLNGKVADLVRLGDSCAGSRGQVKFEGDIISWKSFEAVGDHAASWAMVSGTKAERAIKCHSGYEYKKTSFENLSKLLVNDTAYTPFKFKDGKRNNDNIISGASWCFFDVDDSDMSMHEMHDILGDYNHHISTTSDKDNIYKYRVLIEFNTVVDVNPREWKVFILHMSKELGIDLDSVSYTKSQIMYGYQGSLVLSELESDVYDVTDALKAASQEVIVGEQHKPTITQASNMLKNPLETFKYAFNDDVSARSLTMYRVWKHAKDLNARPEHTEQLMRDLNDFWVNPIEDERLESYITQMRKSYDS